LKRDGPKESRGTRIAKIPEMGLTESKQRGRTERSKKKKKRENIPKPSKQFRFEGKYMWVTAGRRTDESGGKASLVGELNREG